ncbi:hypothetical protein CSUI_004165 [Cystoisospora suis]|uniref:Uncharacterized protein n=1 Tax=Cystoisospora suis TaxID=483139 RepID=A0A2C6L2Q8_9APIC|nr:hypothetical protein CSUI_004165 [Cystoisospora suis]
MKAFACTLFHFLLLYLMELFYHEL